jgi:hypothetical protein
MNTAMHAIAHDLTHDLTHDPHAALRREIDKAQHELTRLYDTYMTASYETADEDFIAWRIANARHSALIEAGVLITLGTQEN